MRFSGMRAPADRLSTTGAARLPGGAPGRPGEVVRLRHGCVKRGWAQERRTWRRGPILPQDRLKMRQTPILAPPPPTSGSPWGGGARLPRRCGRARDFHPPFSAVCVCVSTNKSSVCEALISRIEIRL